ncbi:MAG: ATP-binding protein [Actinobacteria bacterium]|nr:MAG: ATP-binding protein [Actinomycetota bacterium]
MITGRPHHDPAYIPRVIDQELDVLLAQLPALLLDGPRAVGKTTTATQRCAAVRRLDTNNDRQLIAADPFMIADDPAPLLIDEWQRVPPVWDAVRRLIDDDSSPNQFLLTGSAPFAPGHSGAGRIATIRMRPMNLYERQLCPTTISFAKLFGDTPAKISGTCKLSLTDYVDQIIAGGFPGMRHLVGVAQQRQLDSYLEAIVTHDLTESGFKVRRPATLIAWLRAYAAATATATTWEKIRDASTSGMANKPPRTTTLPYIELLTSLRILDPLDAWLPTNNHLARLTSSPKHHLADPALAVRLLSRNRLHLLSGQDGSVTVPRDGTLLGALFESLAALSIRTFAQTIGAKTFHLRTESTRHEIDFIVEHQDKIVAIESKLGSSVDDHDVRHLKWLRDRVGDAVVDCVVLTTGIDAYRRSDGIAVVPLGLLAP